MQAVVAAGLVVGPLAPLVVGLQQAAAGLWDHVVHCEGGARGGGLGDLVQVSSAATGSVSVPQLTRWAPLLITI